MMSLLGGEGGKLKGGGGSAYPYYLLNLGYVTGVCGPQDTGKQYIIPFWDWVLMGSDMEKPDFDFTASLKNEEGKKNSNFRCKLGQIRI